MKRDFNTAILNLEGLPFEDNATLKTVSLIALTTPLTGDDQLSLPEKLDFYLLAQKLCRGGILDITSEEISILKARIGLAFNHVVVIGRAFDLLESDQ